MSLGLVAHGLEQNIQEVLEARHRQLSAKTLEPGVLPVVSDTLTRQHAPVMPAAGSQAPAAQAAKAPHVCKCEQAGAPPKPEPPIEEALKEEEKSVNACAQAPIKRDPCPQPDKAVEKAAEVVEELESKGESKKVEEVEEKPVKESKKAKKDKGKPKREKRAAKEGKGKNKSKSKRATGEKSKEGGKQKGSKKGGSKSKNKKK